MLDQQLCRWLLVRPDRLHGNELVVTQELIANMLGVCREGVTKGAIKLQKVGLIRYVRGRITALDRKGLEKRVCECYAAIKKNTTDCSRCSWRHNTATPGSGRIGPEGSDTHSTNRRMNSLREIPEIDISNPMTRAFKSSAMGC
jgi:hypothetical protein